MKVYVVEIVSYDYYRFDDVIGVALSEEKAIKLAEKYKAENEWRGDINIEVENKGYDIKSYTDRELCHLYISIYDTKE